MPIKNAEKVVNILVEAIRRIHREAGIARAELDVSGGVDSAVMLMLLVRALGASNVAAVYQGIDSSPSSLECAREVAAAAGVRLVEFDGTAIFRAAVTRMLCALEDAGYDRSEIEARINDDPTILGSIRSTMRAPWGRAAGRLTGNAIRHGTGNEDEDRFLRFYQKGGDGEVDTSLLSSLSKGEMYQLAIYLGVPSSILRARPSPDLWGAGEAHNDEDEIRAFLRVKTDLPMYSYVNMKNGEYENVGLIERVARFADHVPSLFADEEPNMVVLLAMFGAAYLPRENPNLALDLLENARRVEKLTRHKYNPALPTLTRAQFGDGLSNSLWRLVNGLSYSSPE